MNKYPILNAQQLVEFFFFLNSTGLDNKYILGELFYTSEFLFTIISESLTLLLSRKGSSWWPLG